jgi:hypothetical protein
MKILRTIQFEYNHAIRMTNAAYFGGAVFCIGRSFPQGPEVVNPRLGKGKSLYFNVKPCAGFTLLRQG